MKSFFACVITLFAISGHILAQPVKNNHGFAMGEPQGWIKTNKAELTANLKKFELTDDDLQAMLKESNGSIILLAYMKYDPNTRPGLIPTVQVRMRSKTTTDYATFRKGMIKGLENFKDVLEGFELEGQPTEVEIDNIKSLLINSRFIMRTKNGEVLKVRSRMYLVPQERHYFQLNFTDGYDAEDCSKEFDELVKTIRIGR